MSNREPIRHLIESDQVVNQLASIEHERWAHWQRYVHDQCEQLEDGSLVIPAQLVTRWELQIKTPYEELSDQERRSDREQVYRYLSLIIEAIERRCSH